MKFGNLQGKVFTYIEVNSEKDIILFTDSENIKYKMYHDQNCCESVYIEAVVGDLEDLLNSPITLALESSNSEDPPTEDSDESYTWTFYKLATVKGYVDIRWYGSSNGYYSESVNFEQI